MNLLCYYLTQLNPYIYTNTIIVPNETITIVCNSGDAKYQHDPNKSHYCEAKLEILDLEFPPQTSEASGGNSVNRIACESRT